MWPVGVSDEAEQVIAQKSVIRRAARARRREMASRRDLGADAERLADHVVALVARHLGQEPGRGAGGRGCRVAAYESYGVEPATDRLIARLVALGHEVILPRMLPDRSLQWTPARQASLPPTTGGGLGLTALATADVVVTPGLAVDRIGTRLGQGGGSYDRALVYRRRGALVVTLLHDGELRDIGQPLPRSVLDLPVDGVVTADGGFVDLR